jgi:hypothetical protein
LGVYGRTGVSFGEQRGSANPWRRWFTPGMGLGVHHREEIRGQVLCGWCADLWCRGRGRPPAKGGMVFWRGIGWDEDPWEPE